MNEFKSYKDLLIMRDVNLDVKAAYEELREILNKNILKGPSGLSSIDFGYSGKSYNWTMESYMVQLEKIDKQIAAVDEVLDKIDEKIFKIEGHLSKLNGLDYKVVYHRDIENLTLMEIADKLGYSVDRIKQISAKNKKDITL